MVLLKYQEDIPIPVIIYLNLSLLLISYLEAMKCPICTKFITSGAVNGKKINYDKRNKYLKQLENHGIPTVLLVKNGKFLYNKKFV